MSVAPSSGCGSAGSLPREPTVERIRSAARRARSARRASSSGAVSSGPTVGPRLRHERAGVDPLVHPDEAHAGRLVTGEDRGRDGRRAAMPGQERRMEIEGAMPQLEESRGHDPPVVGQDDQGRIERQDIGDRRRGRAGAPASGRSRSRERSAASAIGVRAGSSPRPAGRDGAVTTPTRSTRGSAARARSDGRPNPPLPMKTVRTREPPARRPVTRGRSSPRGPRRRPRCPRRPPSARPSSRDSRCTACRRGDRARAGAPDRAARIRRP